MKKLKITKPDWSFSCISEQVKGGARLNTITALDSWFNDNVAPINKILFEGITVCTSLSHQKTYPIDISSSQREDIEIIHDVWRKPHAFSQRDTHQGLLINVRPIKKDTAESLMNEMLEAAKKTPLGSQFPSMQPYLERYKVIVEEDE